MARRPFAERDGRLASVGGSGGLGDIGDLVRGEAAKIGVRGTFNAAAIRGLVAGSAADRSAAATEETARNTKRLVQSAQTGGLTFA